MTYGTDEDDGYYDDSDDGYHQQQQPQLPPQFHPQMMPGRDQLESLTQDQLIGAFTNLVQHIHTMADQNAARITGLTADNALVLDPENILSHKLGVLQPDDAARVLSQMLMRWVLTARLYGPLVAEATCRRLFQFTETPEIGPDEVTKVFMGQVIEYLRTLGRVERRPPMPPDPDHPDPPTPQENSDGAAGS